MVGDLGDHHLGVVGLADHGVDAFHDEGRATAGPLREVGADRVAAVQLRRLAGEGERVGEDTVGGEQVGEHHPLAGHHLPYQLGDFAWGAGHTGLL